jgi:hypothetical protein
MELTFTGKLTKNEMMSFQFAELFASPVTITFIAIIMVCGVMGPAAICLFGYCSLVKHEYMKDFGGLGISVLGLAFFLICAIFFGTKEADAATTVRLTPTSVSTDTPGVSQVMLPVDKVRFKFRRLGLVCRSGRTPVFILPYRILSQNQIGEIKNMYGLK